MKKRVKCAYSGCRNFFEKHGNKKYCCEECKKNAEKEKRFIKKKIKSKPKSLSEVLKIMRDLNYGNDYGRFCAEHPELAFCTGTE